MLRRTQVLKVESELNLATVPMKMNREVSNREYCVNGYTQFVFGIQVQVLIKCEWSNLALSHSKNSMIRMKDSSCSTRRKDVAVQSIIVQYDVHHLPLGHQQRSASHDLCVHTQVALVGDVGGKVRHHLVQQLFLQVVVTFARASPLNSLLAFLENFEGPESEEIFTYARDNCAFFFKDVSVVQRISCDVAL